MHTPLSGIARKVVAEDLEGFPLEPAIGDLDVASLKVGVNVTQASKLTRCAVDIDAWIDRQFVGAALKK